MSMWSETTPVEEAAEQLLGFVKEIRELDAQYEKTMRDKATSYRNAKKAGFDKAAVKAIVNNPLVDDDDKALRKYLDLIVGPQAAAAMQSPDDFARILFGDANSWPDDYVDPKHGMANTPE